MFLFGFNFKALIILLLTIVANKPYLVFGLDANEDQLKAVYLFNFAKYTIWPSDSFATPNAPIMFCVLSADGIASELQKVRGRLVNNRRIEVAIASEIVPQKCHLVYLAEGTNSLQMELSKNLAISALVVSESHDTGSINFVRNGSKLGFLVDLVRARKAGLNFSSELLKIAIQVNNDSN